MLTLTLTLSALSAVSVVTATQARANTTQFYIDNSGSPACSDAFAGTDPSQPWCDFANVNGQTFAPGDSILLRAGDTFSQGLAPLGSGAAGSPITIDSYGSGSRPIINPGSSSVDAVMLQDPSYWTVNDLELTGANNGIHANFTTLDNQGLTFFNLYIHDISGSGVLFDGFNQDPQYQVPSGQYIVSGVTVSWVYVTNVSGVGILLAADSQSSVFQTSACCSNAQQNVVFSDDTITNSSSNALNLPNLSNSTIMSTYVDNGDDSLTNGGGTAAYNVDQDNVTYVNDMFNDTPWASSTDNSAINQDNHLNNVSFLGSYFRNNAGSAIEYTEGPCWASCTSSTNSGEQIYDNAFSENSSEDSSSYYGDIDMTYAPETTGTIQDNLYYDTPQTYNTFAHSANSAYWTLTNNDAIDSDADLYNAAYQYGGTAGQWSYQHWDGSSTSQMTYDSALNRWESPANDYIWQFDMLPAACANCWTMRAWTAPRSGTIQIRGWALKNQTGGDGVQLQINDNGTTLWGPENLGANDQVGFATTATATVNQGDVILFMVNCGSSGNNTDDMVSWAPSIAYTS